MEPKRIIQKCTIPDCEVCKIQRRPNARAGRNKYLPREVKVAPGQMRLGEKREPIA